MAKFWTYLQGLTAWSVPDPVNDRIYIASAASGDSEYVSADALVSSVIAIAGTLADASQEVNGETWTPILAVSATRRAVLIQNRDQDANVELAFDTEPTNGAGTTTPGSVLLQPADSFPPPGFPYAPQNAMWARCTAADSTAALTIKVG